MSYKDLPIDRELIDVEIHKIHDLKVQGPKISNNSHRYDISDQTRIGILIIYFNKNGTTSFNMQGANTDFVTEIADQLIKTCSRGSGANKSISVTDQHLVTLLEFFETELKAKVVEELLEHGKKYTVTGTTGNHITMIHYNTKTLLIQGKEHALFLDTKELVEALYKIEKS